MPHIPHVGQARITVLSTAQDADGVSSGGGKCFDAATGDLISIGGYAPSSGGRAPTWSPPTAPRSAHRR